MKTLKKIGIVLTLALATVLTSCGGDDGGSGGGGFSGPATGNFIKAKVGGSNFNATGQVVQGAYVNGNLSLVGAAINGTSTTQMVVTLYKPGGLTVGTYNAGPNQEGEVVGTLSYVALNGMTPITYNSAACDNASGTIEITTVTDAKIEGTFSFTGVELQDNDNCGGGTKNVTNGSFRLEL